MQKAAITEHPSFVNISVTVHGIKIFLVPIPMFSGVKNNIKSFQQRFLLFLLNTRIETVSAKNLVFAHISAPYFFGCEPPLIISRMKWC